MSVTTRVCNAPNNGFDTHIRLTKRFSTRGNARHVFTIIPTAMCIMYEAVACFEKNSC